MPVMPKHIEFCVPAAKKVVPSGPDWLHGVKYDGYHGRVERDGKSVRVLSKTGRTWRFPWIVEAASKVRLNRFIIDGEIQGISDFEALHSGKHNEEARLYAFDITVANGDDLRELPLFERKERLSKLLRGRPEASRSAVRTGRDRSRPVQGGLQHGSGGPGLKAPRAPLPATVSS
jgi:ATP-dependent DNA ligase